jgi:hypothetical protein
VVVIRSEKTPPPGGWLSGVVLYIACIVLYIVCGAASRGVAVHSSVHPRRSTTADHPGLLQQHSWTSRLHARWSTEVANKHHSKTCRRQTAQSSPI